MRLARGGCYWQSPLACLLRNSITLCSIIVISEPGSAVEQLSKTFLKWASASLERDKLCKFYVIWKLHKKACALVFKAGITWLWSVAGGNAKIWVQVSQGPETLGSHMAILQGTGNANGLTSTLLYCCSLAVYIFILSNFARGNQTSTVLNFEALGVWPGPGLCHKCVGLHPGHCRCAVILATVQPLSL